MADPHISSSIPVSSHAIRMIQQQVAPMTPAQVAGMIGAEQDDT